MVKIAYLILIGLSFWSIPAKGQGKDGLTATNYFEQGEQALSEGNYKKAIDLFNRCLTIHARYEEAFRLRAQAKEGVNDWIGAVTDYSSFLEYNPYHTETLFSRAVARYHAKQFQFAIEDFKKILSIPVGETTSVFFAQLPYGGGTTQILTTATIKNYVLDYIGLAELELKNYDEAIHYFDSAIRFDSQFSDFYAHRAMAYEKIKKYEQAQHDYQLAIFLNPNHSIALHNLDHLPIKNSQMDVAEEAFTQSIIRDPKLPYAYRERAFYRLSKGNYTGALADYDKAIEIDTSEIDTWLNRGLVKEKLNDLLGAYSDYTKVIDLRQDNAKAWMSRGNVLGKLGRDADAIEDYTIAIFYYPDYAQAYYNRAIVKYRTGNSKDACSDLKLAIQYGMDVNEKMEKTFCATEGR